MFPDPENLPSARIRVKLLEGRSPAQIAVLFASHTIALELSTYTREPLDVFKSKLQSHLILEIEEKSEIITFLLNNQKQQALDRLCSYLSRKSAEDIKQFQVMLQTRIPPLADYLNNVISRCEAISKQPDIYRRQDARKLE